MIALCFGLAACDDSGEQNKSRYKGRINAKYVTPEVHNNYLNCYALDTASKRQCIDLLAEKYISKQWEQDEEYIAAFQFESEKLGFKNFLNNLKLPCKSVDAGPKYINEKQAYLVQCKPKGQYFMRFNYDNNEWKLLKESDE